jgi:hypothetical protein
VPEKLRVGRHLHGHGPAAVAGRDRIVQQATPVAQLPRHHAAYELFEVTHLTSALNVRRKEAAVSTSA